MTDSGSTAAPWGAGNRCDHPLVPMSCELPQMKGRNWKSSRPHTPWLPAGSILYVFCNFRITSRYLCRRGRKKEGRKVRNGIFHLQHRKGRENGEAERAFFFSPHMSSVRERDKMPPGNQEKASPFSNLRYLRGSDTGSCALGSPAEPYLCLNSSTPACWGTAQLRAGLCTFYCPGVPPACGGP